MRFTHKTSSVGTPCQYNSWGKDEKLTNIYMLYAEQSTEQRCRATLIHKYVSIRVRVHQCTDVFLFSLHTCWQSHFLCLLPAGFLAEKSELCGKGSRSAAEYFGQGEGGSGRMSYLSTRASPHCCIFTPASLPH